ncbi:MAG: hypothetical protein EOP22_16685 [Hyphomicrobiales bacterium]|nr:MAG: hypothetical protein EOP22_16685 [Hyphomicrobiales bacterium]
MHTISLDASLWTNPTDFYNAVYDALGDPAALPLPHQFGYSVDALLEVMVSDGMAFLQPPYVIRITGLALASETVRRVVETAATLINKEQGDVEMSMVVDVS